MFADAGPGGERCPVILGLDTNWMGRIVVLRRKLGDGSADPTYIFTEPQVSFRMPKTPRPKNQPQGSSKRRYSPTLTTLNNHDDRNHRWGIGSWPGLVDACT